MSVHIAQKTIAQLRKDIQRGVLSQLDESIIVGALQKQKKRIEESRMRSVYNATGVIIHTNLGRSPLPKKVFESMHEVLGGYTNLEIELDGGTRGGRIQGITDRLCPLIGAEAALVVNNNAAAILLAISACAKDKEVLVSRGELVEIGGSFRIPDIIETGGATLVEVGTTNRTRVADYEKRITEQTGAILRVHSSNFSIVGFTERTSRKELVQLAKRRSVPCIEDLGSGLLGTAPSFHDAQRLEEEESIQRALSEGVDLVTFSGDKLLGGPQSGFIVGKKELVQRCAKHPLYRAMRLGKVSIYMLETVLQMYVEERQDDLPVWTALQKDAATCRREAENLKDKMGVGTIIPVQSFSGGGALPNQAIESFGYFLPTEQCGKIARELRQGDPSILVRVQNNGVCVDTRTILPEQMDSFLAKFVEVVSPLL